VKRLLASCILGLFAATAAPAAAVTVEKYEVQADKALNVPASAQAKALMPGGFPLGIGSGLHVIGEKDGALLFWTVTDRGPNVDAPKYRSAPEAKPAGAIIFPAPDFTPTIAIIELKGGQAKVTKTLPIKDESGKPISGRPLPKGLVGSTGETPLGLDLGALSTDAQGLDTEGIDVDKDGNLWLCDEYGPFLIKVDAKSGQIMKKYAPGAGLPEVIAKRQANRGFEGLAVTPSGKIVAVVQSVVDVDGKIKESGARFLRMVELDPATGQVRTLGYPHDVEAYKASRDAKLGDLVALSDTRFLVIEQAMGKDKKMRNLIYLVDIAKATDLSGKKAADGTELESVKSEAELKALGVVLAGKKLLVDLRALGWTADKAEGLTLLPDGKSLAVMNDNDFGIAPVVENPAAGADGKAVDSPGDYVVGADKTLTLDGKPTKATVNFEPNNEKSQLWIIRLDEALTGK